MISRTSLCLLPLFLHGAASFSFHGATIERRARLSSVRMEAEQLGGATNDLSPEPRRPSAFDRRKLLQTAASSAGFLALSSAFSQAAFAGGNVIIDELKIRESIKGIKESVDALQLYEDFIKQKDLYGVKKSLRVPPVSEIRRDCRRVIGGLEGPLKADTDKAYSRFIEDLEKVDLIATRGIQSGKDLEEKQVEELTQTYAKAQVALNDFLTLVMSSDYGDAKVTAE